ncbi:MAG: ImmA/IrrE family metallo-endopeptidase [Blautia sp.]|nr:ImmA/IrrE family metallo-endopeptidase [Blautia sp.]
MKEELFTLPPELISRYGTNDPFRIAGCMKNVHLKYFDAHSQKGFCTNILNNYYIFINENLSQPMKRMVCAHELGHILFHKDRLLRDESGKLRQLVEWELFDIKDSTEYEANLFAANLLINTDALKEMIYEGRDIVSIASAFDVNVNLVALKIAETRFEGVKVPFIPGQNFLGKIKDIS